MAFNEFNDILQSKPKGSSGGERWNVGSDSLSPFGEEQAGRIYKHQKNKGMGKRPKKKPPTPNKPSTPLGELPFMILIVKRAANFFIGFCSCV